jgi:hypothetical protein
MKPASLIAALFLLVVALAHVLRLIMNVQVKVDECDIPMWMSVLGVIGPGTLAVWLLWERKH